MPSCKGGRRHEGLAHTQATDHPPDAWTSQSVGERRGERRGPVILRGLQAALAALTKAAKECPCEHPKAQHHRKYRFCRAAGCPCPRFGAQRKVAA